MVLMALNSSAQNNIHFENITLNQALAQARNENKLVFFMGFASWCEHCKKMKETVFIQDSVAEYYNTHFVCMMMDMEKDEGIQLHEKFKVSSYPTFVFLDSTGQTIYQAVGEMSAGDFIREGRQALKPEFNMQFLRQQFESNITDTDKCLKYLFALNHGRLPTMGVVHIYFTAMNNRPPFTVMNWRILNAGVSDISTPEFKYIRDHQKEYSAVMTQAKVERKIFRVSAYNLQPLANSNDTTEYFQKRSIVTGLNIHSLDSLIFTLDLMLYENNKHWSFYQTTALEHTKDYVWDDYSQLQHIAKQFLTYITDVNALKQAALWAKHSTEMKAEYGNTLLYAQLLEKSGDTDGAKKAAQQAKQIAAITNAPTTEADQLLQRLGE